MTEKEVICIETLPECNKPTRKSDNNAQYCQRGNEPHSDVKMCYHRWSLDNKRISQQNSNL